MNKLGNKSLEEIKNLAMNGDSDAQDALGCFYVNGDGVTKDMYEAASWFRKSAEQGNMDGKYHYACFLENGWGGVFQDYRRAYELYVEAGNAGIPDAQNNAGALLINGNLGTPKYSEGAAWLKKAAAQGNQDAIDNLNLMKSNGLYFDIDDLMINIGFDFSALLEKQQNAYQAGKKDKEDPEPKPVSHLSTNYVYRPRKGIVWDVIPRLFI